MTKFKPKRGDYFKLADLTDDQLEKLKAFYKPHVRIADHGPYPDDNFIGWDDDNDFYSYERTNRFSRLLAYNDVFPQDEKFNMLIIKDKGFEFHDFLESLGDSRELSIAKTKLEEVVMWTVKHIKG